MMKKILLVDYPHPDGQAREQALRTMGFDVRVFNLIKSRVWSGEHPVKARVKPLLGLIAPLKKAVARLDRHRLNRELALAAAQFRPHTVLIIKGDELTPGTLRQVRKSGAALMLNWDGDSMLTPGRADRVIPRLDLYDHYFTVDDITVLPQVIRDRMHARNVNCHTMPFAANTDVFAPRGQTGNDADGISSAVAFVGTINPVRKQLLSRLSDFNLKIWGPATSSWGEWADPDSPLARAYQHGMIHGDALVRVYAQAAVILDIHFLFGHTTPIPNVTMRVFEIPAAGGFTMTNESAQIGTLFKPGEEIVTYGSAEELREKCSYFLRNPQERRKIAEKGRARVLAQHTFRHRLESIFRITDVNKT